MTQLKHNLYLGFVASVLGLLIGVQFGAAKPRPEKADWDNVEQLPQHVQVRVVLNDAKSYVGHFLDANDQRIILRTTAGEQTFSRQDILRVSSKTGSHHLRNAGIGAAIGGGSLAGAAAAKGDSSGDFGTGGVAVLGLIGGSVIGAAVGAVLPSEAWRDVYRITKPSVERSGRTHLNATVPAASPAATQPAAQERAPATVALGEDIAIKSTPGGADIKVDGESVGSTPSTVRMTPGDHTLSIEKPGFKTWQRTMTVSAGGSVTVDATLEKAP